MGARRRVLAGLDGADAEDELGEAVRAVAGDQALGCPEGLGHGAVGQEGHEGTLQELDVARVGLDGLAVERGRRRGVAGGAGDVGGEEIPLERIGGLQNLGAGLLPGGLSRRRSQAGSREG
jgi:hypothetical protein